MTVIFTWAFISACVSLMLIYFFVSLSSKEVKHSRRRSTGTSVIWAGISLLVLFLTACSGLTSSNKNVPPTNTPLATTPTTHSTTTPDTAATSSSDWTTYHANNLRTGYIADTPDPHNLSKIWSTQLDGSVYAEPLVVGNRVIVATEGDSLYALDPNSGSILWHTNVGTPVPLSSLPCGNIDPLGITGTPVYDPATGLVFAVAEVSGPAHILVGLDANTGQVKVRRLVDTDGMDPQAHQQRAALTLANGMVYIAYGGLDGDCSDYIGRVVALHTDGRGSLRVFTVPTSREGGIWAPPGPSVDASGNIYVSVGNGAATGGNWDHSDSILKLSPTLQLKDGFAPRQWPQDNAGDADLGSMGPVLLPGGLIFADGKSGLGYLLHANALGGVGGQIQVTNVCQAFGGSAVQGSTVIGPCVEGIRQVQISADAHITVGWQAPPHVTGSPVIGRH